MGKSKLGSPFKLKNQGIGGAIGTGVAAAVPSILGVLKLKYPDVFETPEDKLAKEELKLNKKKVELEERKIAALVGQAEQEATLKDIENQKEFARKYLLAQKESDLRKQEYITKKNIDLSFLLQEENLSEKAKARVKKLVAEAEGEEVTTDITKATKEPVISKVKSEADVAKIEADVAKKAFDLDLQLKVMQVPIDQLTLDGAKERNRMIESQQKISIDEFESNLNKATLDLKRLHEYNDIEYKRGILALKEIGSGKGAGMPIEVRSQLRNLMEISANALNTYATSESPSSDEAMRVLQISVDATLQANKILTDYGYTQYQMSIPLGIDNQGRIDYMAPSPQGGLEPRQQSQQSIQTPARRPNFQNPEEAIDALIEIRSNYGIETTEQGYPTYTTGKKKLPVTMPGNMAEPFKSYEESKLNSRVGQLANQYNIEIEEVLAFIHAESSYDPDAVGPEVEIKGKKVHAFGLMQLLESTAKDRGLAKEDIGHPLKNMEAGIKHLAWIRKNYSKASDIKEMAWAYNAGTDNYINDILPNDTKKYQEKIWNYYNYYKNHPEVVASAIRNLEETIDVWDAKIGKEYELKKSEEKKPSVVTPTEKTKTNTAEEPKKSLSLSPKYKLDYVNGKEIYQEGDNIYEIKDISPAAQNHIIQMFITDIRNKNPLKQTDWNFSPTAFNELKRKAENVIK
jgi:hypothetical protein